MRPTYLFPAAVIEAIAPDRYEHPDPRVQERMEILCSRAKTSRTGTSAPFRRGYSTGVVFHLIGAMSEYGKLGAVRVGECSSATTFSRDTMAFLDCETRGLSRYGWASTLHDRCPHSAVPRVHTQVRP
jgi:hypothetical protein